MVVLFGKVISDFELVSVVACWLIIAEVSKKIIKFRL